MIKEIKLYPVEKQIYEEHSIPSFWDGRIQRRGKEEINP